MTEENVYRERARLVAFLSTKYPSHLAEASDAEEGFHHVVCVHAPTGQMAWHIADRDRDDFFQHLDVVENDPPCLD